MPKNAMAAKQALDQAFDTEKKKKKKVVPKDIFSIGKTINLIKRRQRVTKSYTGMR
jgi:hypothetical protein